MIKDLGDWFKEFDRRVTVFVEKRAKLETFGALLFMVGMFCAAWAFAWYAHIIGPWLDALLGWGQHDIDSAEKIHWRRVWSTSVCLPGVFFAILTYALNKRKE